MFTHAAKLALTARYTADVNKNVMNDILITILNIDLWILLTTGKCFRRVIKILTPIIKGLFIMSMGSGLLLTYAITHMPENYEFLNYKSESHNYIMEITDASRSRVSYLEKELLSLRTKALNLELTLHEMKSTLNNVCKNDKHLDDIFPDFASEAVGGSVINTPGTESFHQSDQIQLKIFGIPLWRPHYFTPRKIIQPWTQAGECWAFRGSRGNIEIELAYAVLVDRVTLEHIPISASLTGSINSAPKEFRVLGKFRNKYLLLGMFLYDQNGLISQIFFIDNEETKRVPFKMVMLQVLSNWGNSEYTCIYRFKVHGKIYNSYHESLSSLNKNEK